MSSLHDPHDLDRELLGLKRQGERTEACTEDGGQFRVCSYSSLDPALPLTLVAFAALSIILVSVWFVMLLGPWTATGGY